MVGIFFILYVDVMDCGVLYLYVCTRWVRGLNDDNEWGY